MIVHKIVKFFQRLLSERFFGKIVIHFENGKVTHVEKIKTEGKWEFKNLPE